MGAFTNYILIFLLTLLGTYIFNTEELENPRYQKAVSHVKDSR